jgi:hypothetical protein
LELEHGTLDGTGGSKTDYLRILRGATAATVLSVLCEFFFSIVKPAARGMLRHVNRLTKQEQLVLCIIIGLLLLGWTVKIYRTAHPPNLAAEKSKP